MAVEPGWSKTWTFYEGEWREGNTPLMGARTHAAWLCTSVFDGAGAFEGVAPDLELHCARVNESARKLFLKPTVSTETWVRLAQERNGRIRQWRCTLHPTHVLGGAGVGRGFKSRTRNRLGGAW